MADQRLVERIVCASKEMRKNAIKMTYDMGNTGAHIGGGLSLIEIMAVLYLAVMKYDVNNLEDEYRDRLIFSKGHGTLALYTAMEQAGIIQKKDLKLYKKDDSVFSAHPCMNKRLAIEFSSGSLGQGLSLGVGTALALKKKHNLQSKVYVILGDGECDEGSIWEAAASAAHFGLNNIIAVVDVNKLQYDGRTSEVMDLSSLPLKWSAFGWNVCEVKDGHSVEELLAAFEEECSAPKVILANTVKGKGVSFMENNPIWHNGRLTDIQFEKAMQEIENG